MDPWTSQRYKAVNVEQLSTPTDRALVRVKRSFARGSIPIIDQETGEIVRYRPRDRPSFLAGAFVFGIGMIIGMVVVAWPL
jgi:hypothetical protein